MHDKVRLALIAGVLATLSACSQPGAATVVPPDRSPVVPPASATVPSSTAAPLPTPPSRPVALVATVNGEPIPREAWVQQLVGRRRHLRESALPAASDTLQRALDEVPGRVLEELIEEALIRQAARARGLDIPPAAVEQALDEARRRHGGAAALDGWLAGQGLSQEAFRAAIEVQWLRVALQDEIMQAVVPLQPQWHLRHILLATRAGAEQVQAELEAGAAWEALVQSRSVDPGTRDLGGDMGWVPLPLLPTGFEPALRSLVPGERSGVVESEFGFHIVELLERTDERPVSLAMQQRLRQLAWEGWLDTQRAQARIDLLWQTP